MELPERLGKYLLVERIAVGGMAEIFKARTAGLGGFEKVLAVKRLHARYCEDADFIKMLIDEAKIAVQLSHSNIGQIFDLDHIGQNYFISMEYIDGRDLHRVQRRLNDRGKVMPIDLACFVAKELSSGLDYAHRKVAADGTPLRIIHRDVSPQNLLVSWEGEVKIIDFGIAKAARRAYETESGIIKGKFYYMSPEQALGKQIDSRSDIFSLGVVLFEMLTGRLLYTETDNKDTLLNKVREAKIVPPSHSRSDVPKHLDRIVMKALAKDPDERYQSSAAFGDALARFLHRTSPNCSPTALSRFMRGLFEEAKFQSEPVISDEKVLMSRLEFQAESTSLIYPNGELVKPGVDRFDQDPFFADDNLDEDALAGDSLVSSNHPTIGEGSSRDSEINLIDERDIEIIDDDDGDDDLEDEFVDDEVTQVRRPAPPGIIDDLGTLGDVFDDPEPLDDEPTQIYRPQAVLAASPDAEHGPLRGEARLDGDDRGYSDDDEPTVITSITSIEGAPATDDAAEPSLFDVAVRPAEVREATSPRAYRSSILGFDSVKHSPALMVGIFIIVLALGAALAFGVQLFFSRDGTTVAGVDETTEIPQPAPRPVLASYRVSSTPQGARVLVDGAFMGPTPLSIERLQLGRTYRIRLEADGFESHDDVLTPTTEGAQQAVEYALRPVLGTAIITTTPLNAAVSLNGNFVQTSPVTVPGLDTRVEHFVTATLPGHSVAHQRLTWPPGQTEPLSVHLVLNRIVPDQPPPSFVQVVPPEQPDAAPENEPERAVPVAVAQSEPRQTDDRESEREQASRDAQRERELELQREREREEAARERAREQEREEAAERERDREREREREAARREREREREREEARREREQEREREAAERERDEASGSDTETSSQAATTSDDELGRLTVQADSEAHVFVDGRPVSTEIPLMNHEIEPGTHRVKVYFVGLRRFSEERRVRIVAGETRSVHFAESE